MLTSLLDLVKNKATAAAGFQNVPLATPKHHATEGCGCLPAAACCTLLLPAAGAAAGGCCCCCGAAVVLLWCCCNQTASKARNKPPDTLFETSETAKQHLISSPKHSKGTPQKLKLCRCLLLPPTPTCGPHKQQKHLPTAGCSATATCERNHSQ